LALAAILADSTALTAVPDAGRLWSCTVNPLLPEGQSSTKAGSADPAAPVPMTGVEVTLITCWGATPVRAGVAMVAAAGNESKRLSVLPASPKIIPIPKVCDGCACTPGTELCMRPAAGPAVRPVQENALMNDSSPALRVLVVDDEPNIVEVVTMALRFQGFEVDCAGTGREALAAVTRFKPHLMVLDVMLPDMEGFDVAQRLGAQRAGVPIIFLTARDATEDKIRGLSGGGDDYMTKPFSLEELVARIRTILRRTGQASAESGRLVFEDLELDEESREVTRAGAPVELTATEYRLLRYLMLNPRRVLTRAQLLDHVWNYDFGGDGRVLETYISYLRKKLDKHGPSLIRTVRGVGYALQVPRT
jgi:two-component system OmpR family response regulator